MIPHPTRKVLLTIQKHGVKALLMGGQACVLYGAAEVSRDTDLAVLVDQKNLEALRGALAELGAESIAVPPFEQQYLERGFAVHFRCFAPEAHRQRVDIMSTMRGVAPFQELWKHRCVLADADGVEYAVLSLGDLVLSKKTQRDKDWPMIRRLLEADYRKHREDPSELDVQLWLLELRTPELLEELARDFPMSKESLVAERQLLRQVGHVDRAAVERMLMEEEMREREIDRAYWEPLKKELEQMRRNQTR